MSNITNKIKENFMKETINDLWDYYYKHLTNKELQTWDWVVLTASNENQAKIYTNEINYRIKQNMIPDNINYLVVPDPDGKRVGSGGATLGVLKEIKKRDKRKFEDLKILIIHSGGDSKRVPQYSVCGKLFSPVQRELPNGRVSSLFDEFMITFLSVSDRMSPGMVLLSGDVMLSFNPLQVDLFHLDSAAISIKESAVIGQEHGVFLSDNNGRLLEFLHKKSIKELKEKGAINTSNNVDIDTGAIYLNDKICEELYSLVKKESDKYINSTVRLSLYGDFLYPLANNVTFEEYLKQEAEGIINDELLSARKILWKKLSKYQMKVIKTAPSKFIHFGTTSELKNMVTKNIKKYSYLGWNEKVLTNKIDNLKCSTNCSFINSNTIIGKNCYIEKSYIGDNCVIGNDVILSNVVLNNVKIPNDVCLNTLKQNDGTFVTRIYSIDENPKQTKDKHIKFLGKDFINVLKKYDILEKKVWNDEDYSLWEAKIYKKCTTEKESIESALRLYEIFNEDVQLGVAKEYFDSQRISLRESFNNCDATYMKKNEEKIEIFIRTLKYFDLLDKKSNLAIANDLILKSSNQKEQIDSILELVKNQKSHIRYRTYLGLSMIGEKTNLLHNNYEDLCYKEIKDIINVSKFNNNDRYNTKDKVKVELPIRINFAGGWSDTPPYCIENGGSVLNGAFKLNGENPIKVSVEKRNDKKIILRSNDLNVEKEFVKIDELKNCFNTNDEFSLLKAALIVSGIIRNDDNSINDITERIGNGFEFTTDVENIPKGSGLGTSSILAAACLKALYEFLNVDISYEQLASKVLEQEQLMGTGGGWQDQIGGLVPGIKIINTEKGVLQKFDIQNISLSKEMENLFNEKYALIYTGQRRLAKNLLRSIMSSYIRGDEKVVNTIMKIKDVAIEMAKVIDNSDKQKFAELLNKHWELSKKLDKGCTNSCINQILCSCQDLIEAKMICGAGGGGFLQVLLKDDVTKNQLKERIMEVFQDSGVQVYDVCLVREEK